MGQIRVCDVRNLLERVDRRSGKPMKIKRFRLLPARGATKVHIQTRVSRKR
jgi:hypothetical protein